MQKLTIACFVVAIFALISTTTFGAQSRWLGPQELNAFIANITKDGKRNIATKIECAPWNKATEPTQMVYRLTYVPESEVADPPYKWQWFSGLESDVSKIVRSLKVTSEPQRKYRLVQKSSIVAKDGTKVMCGIAYR